MQLHRIGQHANEGGVCVGAHINAATPRGISSGWHCFGGVDVVKATGHMFLDVERPSQTKTRQLVVRSGLVAEYRNVVNSQSLTCSRLLEFVNAQNSIRRAL